MDIKKGREQKRGAGEQQGERQRASCAEEMDRGVSEPDVLREQLQVGEHKKKQKYVPAGRVGSRFRKQESSSTATAKKGVILQEKQKKRASRPGGKEGSNTG